MNDLEKGKFVVKKFYDYWKGYAAAFGISYEQLLNILKSRRPMGGESFISGLGLAVKNANISDSKIEEAMRKLAAASQGKLPEKNMDFFNALNGVAISYSFVDATAFVVTESAKDIAGAAQSVGNSLITTGKILNFFLPVILIFALFVFLDGKSNGAVVKGIRSLKGLRK